MDAFGRGRVAHRLKIDEMVDAGFDALAPWRAVVGSDRISEHLETAAIVRAEDAGHQMADRVVAKIG